MNPLFRIDFSISDSLKIVRKSVLIYETIIRSYFEIARELRSGPCRKKNGYVSDLGNYTVYREFADNSVRGGAK